MPQTGKCATCQHFDVRKEYVAGSPGAYVGSTRINLPPNDPCGTCRRWPPLASINTVSVWPIVREDEWCSEWKANSASVFEKAVQRPGKIDRRIG